jgi:hypothetical protein
LINRIRPSNTPLILAVILTASCAVLWGCAGREGDLQDKLKGQWGRTDGNYTLDISGAGADGALSVTYLNPSPIHVGRAAWRIHEEVLQIYIELRDENYPGSLYQLAYEPKSDILYGTYYQAALRQTFEVYFSRKE